MIKNTTGMLNGLTILRFAKILKSGGGIETHLSDLDKTLLSRNTLKIIRTYIDIDGAETNTDTMIGKGHLVEIPLKAMNWRPSDHRNANLNKNENSPIELLKRIIGKALAKTSVLLPMVFKYIYNNKAHRNGEYPLNNASDLLRKWHVEHKIDLLIMHHLGTKDCEELLKCAKSLKIPFIFINHYSNDHLNAMSIRRQITNHTFLKVAGVTGYGVPGWIKSKFFAVSNGIDLDYFRRSHTSPPEGYNGKEVIIYPARIIPNKGQKDLVIAFNSIVKMGLDVSLVLAGRIDSEKYFEELVGLLEKYNLKQQVRFLGQLEKEELRSWYSVASVMAFPTYHQEGMPRILMEAQAMKVPPVAYIIGGTPEAIDDGRTGFLVKKGDVKQLTKKVVMLVKDREMRNTMGEHGRQYIEQNYSLKAQSERHEKLYSSTLLDAARRSHV